MTTIPLPWPRPPLTSNRVRGNVYARNAEVAAVHVETRWAIAAVKPTIAPPCEITLHYRPATRHRRDPDGLYPTAKAVIDALVKADVGLPDDGWEHVRAVTCRIHPPTSEPAAMWLTASPSTEETP